MEEKDPSWLFFWRDYPKLARLSLFIPHFLFKDVEGRCQPKVRRSPSDSWYLGAKTCHYFPRLRVYCPFVLFVFASSSGWAVVYSGDKCRIGDEAMAIFCMWRLNKTLIVDKFRHFSSAVFVLSVLCSMCMAFFHRHQRECLTLSWNQFILCEIIVLMASFSPPLLIRLPFLTPLKRHFGLVCGHTNPRSNPLTGRVCKPSGWIWV